MTKIEEIRDVVKNYQKTADRWFNDYNTKTAKIRERYKESVAKDEIMMNVWPNIFGNLEAERDRAKEKIEELCEDVKADIKKWTLKPISGNTLELLRAVHDFKIPLTKSELEMIQSDVDGNLLASKIFAGLASDYGYAVAVPNVDGLLQELRELESYAKVSVDAYAGRPGKNSTFPGSDLLGRKKINGVAYGEFAIWEKALAADFVEKNQSLQRTADLLEGSKVSLSYTLTEKETARIKGLISDIDTNSKDDKEKRDKMSELLQEPDMAAKINLMDAETKDLVTVMIGGQQIEGREG